MARLGKSHVPFERCSNNDKIALEYAARFRFVKVAQLKTLPWLMILSWVSVVVLRWADLGPIGQTVQAALGQAPGLLHDLVPKFVLSWDGRTVSMVGLVLTAGLSYAILSFLWSLWDNRDGTYLADRRIGHHNVVALLTHFFALLYLEALAAVLALVVFLCLDWPLALWSFVGVQAAIVFLLVWDLLSVSQKVFREVVEHQQAKRIPVAEAAEMAGTIPAHVVDKCPPVNWLHFDALAYDDAFYEEQWLVDERDVQRLAEEVKKSREVRPT